MQNSKVKEVSLVTATNVVDNSTDEAREYDIRANVETAVAEVRNITNGEVRERKSQQVVGTFYSSQHGSDSINPMAGDSQEKIRVATAIYGFIDAVKALYANPNEY